MLKLMKFGARLISKPLFWLPRSAHRGISWALAILWFDILRIRRKIVLNNLLIAFPESTLEWRIKTGRHALMFVCKTLIETIIFSRIDQKWIQKNVVYDGIPNIEKAVAMKKGILGLSLHLDNGDMGANLVAKRGFPITIITKFFKNKTVNDFWFSLRNGGGVEYIEPHGTRAAFDILKHLKRSRIVIFVLDQFMGRPYGVRTNFFGRPTGTAYGLALFYLKTRAPVMPVYCFEEKDHKIHVVFGEILDLERFVTDDQEKSVQNLTQYFTEIIEGLVRKNPEQWMWLHRRWKTFE